MGDSHSGIHTVIPRRGHGRLCNGEDGEREACPHTGIQHARGARMTSRRKLQRFNLSPAGKLILQRCRRAGRAYMTAIAAYTINCQRSSLFEENQ
jgi:hypothetical protein